MDLQTLFALNLYVTIALTTLIWFVQILHYPSFLYYDTTTFMEGMTFHQRRISYLVVPLMLTEVALTTLTLIKRMDLQTLFLAVCVLTVWLSTFLLQVPIHSKLTAHNKDLIHRLNRGNVIRTAAWTLKLIVLLTL